MWTVPPPKGRRSPSGRSFHRKRRAIRHDSIPAGWPRSERLGRAHGFRRRHTADAGALQLVRSLSAMRLVFLSTTGTPIERARATRARTSAISVLKAAVRRGARRGGHARRWPWYERLVGARFKPARPRHPSRGRVRSRIARAPRRAAAGALDAQRRVVRVPLEPDRTGARAGDAGRTRPLAVVSRLRWRPLGVHRDGTYEGVVRRASLLGAPARRVEMAAGRARFDCAP